MKVYRYATKEEVERVLCGDLSSVGTVYQKIDCNTHKYKDNIKYLHFFKKITGIDDVKKLRDNNKTYYICEYDIPLIVLLIGRGTGYYDTRGYENDVKTQVEYIVPVETIKPQWLKKYIIDNVETTSETETTF